MLNRFFIYLALFITLELGGLAHAEVIPIDLKKSIEEKNLALQEINQKIIETQKDLEGTAETKQTLQKELKKADYTINQVTLGIKSTELNIQKLSLEMEALKYEIGDTKSQIESKKNAVASLLSELQKKDEENPLLIFLKNKSISESFDEVQGIVNINSNLSSQVVDLRALSDQLSSKLSDSSVKKNKVGVENTNLKSKNAILKDEKDDKQALLTQTKNQEKIYQQQLAELKKNQDEISKEIDEIEAELRKTIDKNFLPTPRPGVLLWPVNGGRLTQGYGRTSFAIISYVSQWHNGIDIGAPIGTELFAAERGEVINVGNQDAFRACKGAAYGKFVVIKHENGLTSLYGHLSKYVVSIGQKVERGEVIGYLGKSGWSTGPHLHYTVFASQTLTPAHPGLPEGSKQSRVCGPMPVGGDLNPLSYLNL